MNKDYMKDSDNITNDDLIDEALDQMNLISADILNKTVSNTTVAATKKPRLSSKNLSKSRPAHMSDTARYEKPASKTNSHKSTKIVPLLAGDNSRTLTETMESSKTKKLKEKTLHEMGFSDSDDEFWDEIEQAPKEPLLSRMKDMIDTNTRPNAKVHLGNKQFECHMMVLQCFSKVFMDCNNEVLIHLPVETVTPQAFMYIYQWMLHEELPLPRKGILAIFTASQFLKIPELVHQCWVYFDDENLFCEDTAFTLYLEARNFELETLQDLMLTRISKFFMTIVASTEFLSLSVKEVVFLLHSNTIGVNSEIEIFYSMVRWITHDWENRKVHLNQLIDNVRFTLLPPWFLVSLNNAHDVNLIGPIVSNPDVKKLINDGISYSTTLRFYKSNYDHFLYFLERYKLTKPIQRHWVIDKNCPYHTTKDSQTVEMQDISYETFLNYLSTIQKSGFGYWQNLRLVHGEEDTDEEPTEENNEDVNIEACYEEADESTHESNQKRNVWNINHIEFSEDEQIPNICEI